MSQERINISDLSLSSPSEAALTVVKGQFSKPDVIVPYLLSKGAKPGEVTSMVRQLNSFLSAQLVEEHFSYYWKYETSEIWKGRSVATALEEAVGHTLTTIHALTQDHLADGSYPEKFPGMTRDQIQVVDKISKLAGDIYNDVIIPNKT